MIAEALPSRSTYSTKQSENPRHLQQGTAVLAVVLVLRLWVLFRSADTVHFLPNESDMKFYSDWALRIAGGRWTDHQAFYGLPLYAYLLAGLYAAFGFQPYIALLLQVLTEAATALLIFRLAHLAFAGESGDSRPAARRPDRGTFRTNSIGWLAAMGWAFFVPAQVYASVLMPTVYFVTAFWFVVWWTLRHRTGLPGKHAFFLLGLLMGVVAMMTANILFLAGFVVAALFFRRSWVTALPAGNVARWRSRAAAALLLSGGIAVGTSPCWVHNYFVAGEPVLLSAHSGINFWIGNNPEANGYPKIPGGMRASQEGLLNDSLTFAEKATGRPLRHYEVSAYWSDRAHRYIAAHPAEFFRLLAVKLGNFWNGFQYDDLGAIVPMQEDGIVLPGISFATAAIFGLPGLFLAIFRRPRSRWIAAAVLVHMASLLTVFVTERYRLAAVPGLLLLGSFGVVEAAGLLARRRWLPAAAYAAAFAVAGLLVLHPVSDASVLYITDYNTGLSDLESHHLERAHRKLERVYTHNPNNPESVFAMGNLAMAEDRRPAALQFYRRTLELDPQHHRALNNLGVLAMQDHQWLAAEALLGRARLLAPDDAKLSYLLARTCLARKNTDGARDAIDAALRIKPQSAGYLALRKEIDQAPSGTEP